MDRAYYKGGHTGNTARTRIETTHAQRNFEMRSHSLRCAMELLLQLDRANLSNTSHHVTPCHATSTSSRHTSPNTSMEETLATPSGKSLATLFLHLHKDQIRVEGLSEEAQSSTPREPGPEVPYEVHGYEFILLLLLVDDFIASRLKSLLLLGQGCTCHRTLLACCHCAAAILPYSTTSDRKPRVPATGITSNAPVTTCHKSCVLFKERKACGALFSAGNSRSSRRSAHAREPCFGL